MKSRVLSIVLVAACSNAHGQLPSDSGHVQSTDARSTDARIGDSGSGSSGSDGGLQITTSGISIIVEPDGNEAQQLVTAINAATTSIDMTMYEIDNAAILSALEARAMAGVRVRAVLDSSGITKALNGPSATALGSAGASVVWSSSSFAYTHQKTVMIDQTTAWIMTMNLATSTVKDNREYLAIDTNAADVAEAEAIFAADFALTPNTPTGDLVVSDSNSRTDLIALIGTATKTLDVEVEEFSDVAANGVVDAIVAAANAGVTVRIVIAKESPLSSTQTAAIADVKAAGVKIVMSGAASGGGTPTNPYIHAKAILIDCDGGTDACARGFIGSENLSTGSLEHNRELGVIFDNQTELAKVETAINTDFAAGVEQ
jgi:phosphatidylserine/phosphatidylglycerophosphate/cardiolipin synthase-like enzyme